MRPLWLPLALLLALLAGCDVFDRPPLGETFGAPYDLLLGAPSLGDGRQPTPFVSDARELVVAVAYRGGCHPHHFSLRYTIAGGVAQLWIVHEDFDDACGERVEEEVRFPLTEAVLAQPSVVLLQPDGGTVALQAPVDR